jgi:hypothetical protein
MGVMINGTAAWSHQLPMDETNGEDRPHRRNNFPTVNQM